MIIIDLGNKLKFHSHISFTPYFKETKLNSCKAQIVKLNTEIKFNQLSKVEGIVVFINLGTILLSNKFILSFFVHVYGFLTLD